MTEEQIERLNDFCGVAEQDLDRIKDQLHKIIEVRKKKASESGKTDDDMMLQQAKDVLATMENLEKINFKLPGAIQEIKELCKKVHLLLGPRTALKEPSPDELHIIPEDELEAEEKPQEEKPEEEQPAEGVSLKK